MKGNINNKTSFQNILNKNIFEIKKGDKENY